MYLNLSRALASKLSVGVSGRFYYEKVMDLAASGLGVDLGVDYKPVRRMNVGVAVNDFGSTMRFQYGDVQLPARAGVGVSYALPMGGTQLLGAGDFGYGLYTRATAVNLGAEFLTGHGLAVRAGYRVMGSAHGLTAGLGFQIKGLRLDYSIAMNDLDLGPTHQLALGFGY
jgi:hypothetical protein